MESRVCPIPNALSYTSAPSSPGRSPSTTLNAYFFSVPTSPSRSRDPSELEFDPRTPNSDDFRFGSLEFPQRYDDDDVYQYHQDMPIMAYADDLFQGGKMLPLKLPPRLQSGGSSYRKRSGSSNGRMISSTASSPGSRSSRFKMPFRRSSNEFDPFVAALEKVKENGHHHHHHLPMRSRSLSPLKWGWGLRRSKSMGPDGPAHLRRVNGQSPNEAALDSLLLRPGAKGVEKAEARRQRIKRFLMKSASFGWKTNRLGKEECKTALLWNPHESRRGMEATTERRGNAVVRFSRGIKSLVKHRPRLFCRTFGLQRAPKMN